MTKNIIEITAIHPFRTEELFDSYARIEAFIDSAEYLERKAAYDDEEDEEDYANSADYDVINGTAVYKISGGILSSGNWLTRIFGYASYDEIRRNVMHAATNPEVQDVLLMFSSPGGSAFGVVDGAEAIKKADAIKPVYSYTSSMCCSGAYWLGSQARKIFVSPESESGSLGVKLVHVSREKQLQDEGILVTEIKSSELKAVGSPHKNLSDKELSHLQDQVNQIATIFSTSMQKARPNLKTEALNGATFIGEEAVRVGLADAVLSYDDVMQYIQTQRSTTTQTHGGFSMNKQALRAALDSGKSLDEIGCTQEEVDKILNAEENTSEEEVTEPVVAEETELALEVKTEDISKQLSTLTDALVEKDQKIANLEATIAAASAKFEAQAVTLKQIVAEVTTNRRIALNFQSSVDLTKFSTESLLAEYEAVTDAYDKEFKTGGLFKKRQASVEEPKGEQSPLVQDSIHEGQLRAANITR